MPQKLPIKDEKNYSKDESINSESKGISLTFR